MEYVRADIEQRASLYQNQIKKWAKFVKFPLSLSQLERAKSFNELLFPYLDGEKPCNTAEFNPCALYWHFGKQIEERFSDALDILQWPDNAIAVEDRRTQIAEIDAKLIILNAKRDELANDLMSSGMYE